MSSEKGVQTTTKTEEDGTLQPDPGFWTKTSCLQLGYGVWVNLTVMTVGLAIGFTAVAVPQLKKDKKMVMTTNEEALVASILTLFSPIGCVICGIVLDRCGRKIGLVLCHVPFAIGWFYISFAKTATNVIIGRVITGIAMGMVMIAPRAYVTEVTLPNMRGVIGGLSNFSIATGLTIQATLGAFLNWRVLCYVCGGYSVTLAWINLLLPETPYYLLMKSTTSKTRDALSKFRSKNFDIDSEIQAMYEFKTENNIRRLTVWGTIKAMFSVTACKPFLISIFYLNLAHAVGISAVTAWAVEILELSGSSVDKRFGNVALSVTRMVVGVFSWFLLFRVGRRPMALVSAIGVGAVSIILGAYLFVYEGGVYPLILLVTYIGFSVPGYLTLPILMMFEMMPLQVRGILSGCVLSLQSVTMFGATLIFPTMRDGLGLPYTFFTYGISSLLGAIVLFFILPETKGLTLQEIEEYFNHRRSTLVSERILRSAQLLHQSPSIRDETKKHTRRTSQERKFQKLEKKRSIIDLVTDTSGIQSKRVSKNLLENKNAKNKKDSDGNAKTNGSEKNKRSKKHTKSDDGVERKNSELDETQKSSKEDEPNQDKKDTLPGSSGI